MSGALLTPEELAAIRRYNEHHVREDVTRLLAHLDAIAAATVPVVDEAIAQAANLGALIRTDPRLKGTPMALEVKLLELRAILQGRDPA